MHRRTLLTLACTLVVTACAHEAPQPIEQVGFGRNPTLPEQQHKTIPTVNVADAVGWSTSEVPTAGAGMKVNAFASDLDHPRWLYVLPNGDVLVAETNAPVRPDEGKGVKGYFMKSAQKKAGAGVESPNRITLLRDTDGDGVADKRTVFLQGLNSPFGMALIGNTFYVANTDAIMKFEYAEGATEIKGTGTKVADLPGGPRNHHWTKNIIANSDGSKLYATVGSNSNVQENGVEVEEGRAAIWEVNTATGQKRLYATGIRNPNGLAWQPQTKQLWAVVNERDELGDNLVPDYMTSVKEGAFYGWPYSYYGQHLDARAKPPRPDLVAKAVPPDYALGSHTASLGLTFYSGSLLPAKYHGGAFVGQHGSWNRDPRSGYKVIFVPFASGVPAGTPEDVLTGFLNDKGEARGRPVGVVVDNAGALLVADDVGNKIWRVTPAADSKKESAISSR
jgi:glucose/arabinose dehydrogenase